MSSGRLQENLIETKEDDMDIRKFSEFSVIKGRLVHCMLKVVIFTFASQKQEYVNFKKRRHPKEN
jgi:hypothetical protein